ncbi:MAG: hypothetical protein WA873_12950 [Jannaschia helgolandensis]|mgnify:CR=1 FL=1|jgi:uncharacterized membrane protein YccC
MTNTILTYAIVFGPLVLTGLGFLFMGRFNKRKLAIGFGLFIVVVLVGQFIGSHYEDYDIAQAAYAYAIGVQMLHVIVAAAAWLFGRLWRRLALQRHRDA